MFMMYIVVIFDIFLEDVNPPGHPQGGMVGLAEGW